MIKFFSFSHLYWRRGILWVQFFVSQWNSVQSAIFRVWLVVQCWLRQFSTVLLSQPATWHCQTNCVNWDWYSKGEKIIPHGKPRFPGWANVYFRLGAEADRVVQRMVGFKSPVTVRTVVEAVDWNARSSTMTSAQLSIKMMTSAPPRNSINSATTLDHLSQEQTILDPEPDHHHTLMQTV